MKKLPSKPEAAGAAISSGGGQASRGFGMAERVAGLDWEMITRELDGHGCAVAPGVLTPEDCRTLAGLYRADAGFRSHTIMAEHGYGRGEYKYWAYPLPEPVAALRTALYARLAPVANRWNRSLGIATRYPAEHAAYQRRCHRAGQVKPTPLLLQYGEGDFNCLHQDLYGDLFFPMQVAFLLSEPGRDFTGGEFVLTEERPREQTSAEVVTLRQGDGVIFAVQHRPVPGEQGMIRTQLRHGVSRLRSGQRHTLGIIFHDAK